MSIAQELGHVLGVLALEPYWQGDAAGPFDDWPQRDKKDYLDIDNDQAVWHLQCRKS